jgi:hypothetical protein
VSVIRGAKRLEVRQRANWSCEYCLLPEEPASAATSFQADHIWPESAAHASSSPVEDVDDIENLAWGCPLCNRYKSKSVDGVDPETGNPVRLFHPRQDRWEDHFVAVPAGHIEGIDPIGRATVQVLRLNLPERVKSRALLFSWSRWPSITF